MSSASSLFALHARQATNQNELRLVWTNPKVKGIQYGSFLFNTAKEVAPALAALEKKFPDYVIWVEDREHNKVDVKKGGLS